MKKITLITSVIEDAKEGAVLKVVHPDGSEAIVRESVYCELQPEDIAKSTPESFVRMYGEPAYVVLRNTLKERLGL